MPLGTLGSLSTVGASLDAGLVLGWGPSETVPQDDAAAVWVRLPALTPGVAGYSLQGVLKTSFGDGNLLRFERNGRGVHALLFNNVALKLFGITLPPGVVLDFVSSPTPARGAAPAAATWAGTWATCPRRRRDGVVDRARHPWRRSPIAAPACRGAPPCIPRRR